MWGRGPGVAGAAPGQPLAGFEGAGAQRHPAGAVEGVPSLPQQPLQARLHRARALFACLPSMA